MTPKEYDKVAVGFEGPDGEGPVVYRRCPHCGRFVKRGEVYLNGLGQTVLRGWKCARCGDVEPSYEYV